MSSRNCNNNRNHTQKKFCGVCHKAGKPESEYTSHYTKSEPGSNGVVTCPIIKNNKCNKCEKYGHFQDHCSFVKKNLVHDSKQFISNHGFEKPKKSIVVAVEPDYEDLFPPLSGVKRSRDSDISNSNQYDILRCENDFDSKKKNGISYKTMLKKEPKIVVSEPKFESGLVDLHSYVKKEYSVSHFIHHDVDIGMSKRILPVEINEDLLESDDEDWDGSWY